MPFIGDSRRRQLRRLSTKGVSQASTTSKESPKTDANSPDDTQLVKQRRIPQSSRRSATNEIPSSRTTEQSRLNGSTKTPGGEHVNVFAFMERDGASSGADTEQEDSDVPGLSSSGSSTSSRSEHAQPLPVQSPYSDLEVHAAASKAGSMWYDNRRRESSIYSDSGISMLSASPENESPVLGYKSRFHNVTHRTPTASHNKIMNGLITTSVPETPAGHMNNVPSMDLRFMEEPEAYYGSSPQLQPQTPRTATATHFEQGLQATWQPSPYQSSPGSIPPPSKSQMQVEKSGYDLLASAIDSRDQKSLTPIYRKFETLNNRILLYLQDEIAEMEEALKGLDAAIIQDDGHGIPPRRTEATYPSQAKWHRQELMCRIFAKVEQYSEWTLLNRTLGIADPKLS